MKISIITICFNAATDLENTIASVRSQKYKDYEYIVVDGGSKDATLAVINDNSDKITKWVSEPDKGIYDAMNKGIKMASGEWVIMMNAGDVFADSQVLQNVFSHAIPDSITFLYGDILIRQKDGSLLRRVMSWQNGNVNHQAVIYRRRLHDEHGLYIVTKKIIVSDYLFFVRIPEEQVQKIDLAISINDTMVFQLKEIGLDNRLCVLMLYLEEDHFGVWSDFMFGNKLRDSYQLLLKIT